MLGFSDAIRAVQIGCEHIKNDDLQLEGKILMLDDFQIGIVTWYHAGLIQKEWIDDLQTICENYKRGLRK